MRKQVPKYVKELLRKRTETARKFRNACAAVDNYCESIGLDLDHPLFNDACLVTDIRILCEEDHSEPTTLKIIEKVLNGETE